MAGRTTIEWTEATWNPVTGCDKVSPGCAHCYAETLAERFRGVAGHPYEQGFDLKLWPQRLQLPLTWRRPRLVFVNSMSDLFHEAVPETFIQAVFATMCQADQHQFQILTKRGDRLAQLAPRLTWPQNVWMGVSIENRRFVDRADRLRATPAAVKFISAEPLLGPLEGLNLYGIDWVIAGGESGHRHRPMHLAWLRDLRDRCKHDRVAFFFKQWGGRTPKAGGRLLDGVEWSQFPRSLPRRLTKGRETTPAGKRPGPTRAASHTK
jgi:protein gp37